ncbi:hypothetical protein L218DRAFT_169470 [Marasmius fiardii PR-910]|nr:hypothetical protein L218DRAFT_169470 [Marasmius fiardii PR-910]
MIVKEEYEDLSHVLLSDQMQKLSLPTMGRFFGASSAFSLIHSVDGVRKEVTGDDIDELQSFKRSQFWQVPPWELETAKRERPSYTFPEHSLMVPLISLYFQRVNVLFPVLHAPTFKRNVVQGLHLVNPYFGAVVLVVCALGSRYSDDKRVLSFPDESLSAGWKWFEQVPLLRRSQFDPPTLYELQYYALAAAYVVGTSSPGTSWYLVGLGIRTALDMGAHRRMSEAQHPTVEGEQRKRAFWVLIVLDRLISGVFVGRPFAIREDDFDVELPIECDDEYWEIVDSELVFKQPLDKPSYISSFVALVKLCEILVIAVRKLFTIPKLQPRIQEVEQQAVVEVDSALNNWKSRLPQFRACLTPDLFSINPQSCTISLVHWDSTRERGIFFEQSGFLHIYYHVVQIQTHRRFVHKSSALSFSSLAICTNAAKSCSHIFDALMASDASAVEFLLFSGFTAGCLILSNLWASKRAGVKVDVKKAMADVEKLKNIFRLTEKRLLTAGRFLDFLNVLSGGIEDNEPSAQHAAPILPGTGGLRQQFDEGHHATLASPTFGGDSGHQSSNVVHGQNHPMDPIYEIFGTYSMQSDLPPAVSSGGSAVQEFQSENRADLDGGTQTFGVSMWPEPEGFAFGGWNSYATNMASLDLDTFMQSNPDVFF